MGPGGWFMVLAWALAFGALFVVVFSLVRGIKDDAIPGLGGY